MCRKKRDCSRAVISEPPHGDARWKLPMPARCATRSIRSAPSRVTTSDALRLFDHRTIGLRRWRSSRRSGRERTSGERR